MAENDSCQGRERLNKVIKTIDKLATFICVNCDLLNIICDAVPFYVDFGLITFLSSISV